MQVETARLRIRPFCEQDADALYEILSDAQVMRWIEAPYTREQTLRFLRRAGLCTPPLVYAVLEKAGGQLIGQLIWHPWDDSSMELGWILRGDRWGRGLASELTEAMLLETGKDVVVECVPEQTATMRIAKRFGFVLEEDGSKLLRFRKTRE